MITTESLSRFMGIPSLKLGHWATALLYIDVRVINMEKMTRQTRFSNTGYVTRHLHHLVSTSKQFRL